MYHKARTTKEALYKISSCFPITDKYIDHEYTSCGEHVIVKRVESVKDFDLSKAKISFKDSNGNVIKKIEYSGNPINDDNISVVVTCKINGMDTVLKVENYTVDFVNNVNKGKAVVIIKGAEGQSVYVGSKTASFSIVTKKV